GRRRHRLATPDARALRLARTDPDAGRGRKPERLGGHWRLPVRDGSPAGQSMTNDPIAAARAILHDAESCVVLTGAGRSAEGGIPTFGDALTGEWASFDPMKLATPEGFRADPALVWRWYDGRRRRIGSVQPNAGHFALVGLEKRFKPFAIVTQNVDGLH